MKTLNRIWISFAIYALTVIVGLGVANAGQVTVNYQVFPSGPVLDSNIITGCDTATANTYAGYEFLFWDAQSSISWTPTVSICPGSGKTVATAWYLATGGGGTCPPGCSVATFAFSIDHDEVLMKGTPIALVTPDSPVVWTSPSTTVDTDYSSESISAQSALAFPPHKAEPFRYWQELGTSTETPIGVVYQASQYSTALVVAFYGPDPCQNLAGEVLACEQEGGLDCAPLIAELRACQKQNREIQ